MENLIINSIEKSEKEIKLFIDYKNENIYCKKCNREMHKHTYREQVIAEEIYLSRENKKLKIIIIFKKTRYICKSCLATANEETPFLLDKQRMVESYFLAEILRLLKINDYTLSAKRYKKIIGRNIYNLRIKNKISINKLASKIGIGESMLINIEKGVSPISVENICKISSVLGVPISRFFKNEFLTV